MSDTLERVLKVVREHLRASGSCTEPEKATATSSLADDLGCDSLDQIEIVVALEDEFDIHIDDDKSETLRSIPDAVRIVDELRTVAA